MSRESKSIILLTLFIFSNLFFVLPFNNSNSNDFTIKFEESNNIDDIPDVSNGDGNSKVIVFFNKSWYNDSVISNFTYYKGDIQKEWNNKFNSISMFSGVIPTVNITLFQNNITDAIVETDEIINTQMNYATVQTEAVNSSWYTNGYKGDINSSVAVMDTGIDPNHKFFPLGYDTDKLSGNIIGWEDILNGEVNPLDDHGHGTFISSVIAGTGTENSADSITINIQGNYSHEILFNKDTSKTNYTFKILSFNASKEDTIIVLNSSWNLIETGISDFWFELIYNETLVNLTYNINPNEVYNFTHLIPANKLGIYDLYVKYYKNIQLAYPVFTINANLSFIPENYTKNYKSLTGIANATKIVSYKILNQSGLGYTSDLIDAMLSVIQNKSKYHIVSVCLSIGTLGEGVTAINAIIDEVVKNGTLVVIAAGNSGIEAIGGIDPINRLAKNKNAIVVGAINDKDQMTSYSSIGQEVGSDILKPDIVAPGGSKLQGHRTIFGADYKTNESKSAYGTSIAAAIVSAAINILIEAKWGDWNNWNSPEMAELAKIVKATLLMTASETNLEREDDPDTIDYDESEYSPSVSPAPMLFGLKDEHEGYGRLNIQSAIDALIKFLVFNKTVEGTLTSSEDNPLGNHTFARRVSLEKSVSYIFNLTEVTDANFDLYLFSNESNKYGEPILLASSRRWFADNNYFYFTPNKNQTECILVLKAIDGTSDFKLKFYNITNQNEPKLSVPEILYVGGYKNTTVMSYQEYIGNNPAMNYTIDTYRFYIHYSDNDTSNAPAQEIYVSIDGINNYTLTRAYPELETNFTEGVLYWSDYINLRQSKTYNYFFVASDGLHRVVSPQFSIEVSFPTDAETIPYEVNFKADPFFPDDWELVGTGWNRLDQVNFFDDRSRLYGPPEFGIWQTIYFGTYHSFPSNYTYQPSLPLYQPYPNGTVTSPIFNLTGLNENTHPIAKFGIRVSINAYDDIRLIMSLNWTEEVELATYTNEESEWHLEQFNLSEYKDYYIQFRLEAEIDNFYDPIKNNGFMFDYFALENYTNDNDPVLYGEPTVDIVNPDSGSKYQRYTFNCEYYDADNNYPEFILIEINNTQYPMLNLVGDWAADSTLGGEGDNGILFSKTLVVGDLSNRSFRFLASDGNTTVRTVLYNELNDEIQLVNPDPLDLNYKDPSSQKYIAYDFANDNLYDYFVAGTPTPKEYTAWLEAYDNWHPINFPGVGDVLYCGKGEISFGSDNLGYDDNWDAKLITRPVHIGDDHNVYLEYTYNLSLHLESPYWPGWDDPDQCVVLISKDYGETWHELRRYDINSDNQAGIEKIDITLYADYDIMVMFEFITNDEVPPLGLRFGFGWFLSDISIGYDKNTDFIKPTIEILEPSDNTIVLDVVEIIAKLSDDRGIDVSRIQIYLNNENVDKELFEYDEEKGILTFEWDTREYQDNIYEIKIVAYDEEGNREEVIIDLVVDNGLFDFAKWGPWLVFILIAIIAGLILFYVSEKKGKVWVEKVRNYRAEKHRLQEIDKIQAKKRVQLVPLEEELKRPYTLHCKHCKSWFSSDKFDIMCPVCDYDQIYAAYNCTSCKKWIFKDTPKEDYYCDKCTEFKKVKGPKKLSLIKQKVVEEKDKIKLIRREREEVEEILAEQGKFLREFKFDKKDKKYSILD